MGDQLVRIEVRPERDENGFRIYLVVAVYREGCDRRVDNFRHPGLATAAAAAAEVRRILKSEDGRAAVG